MVKRAKLEIIRDILYIIKENHGSIKITPLIRKSNLSSTRFNEYFCELMDKGFVRKINNSEGGKVISLTDLGSRYLEKYVNIVGFIEEFNL